MILHMVKYKINNVNFRLLTNIPGDAFGIKKLLVMMKDVRQYVAKKMEMHTNSFDPNNIRDYIDCFILEANRRNQKESDNTHFFQGNIFKIALVK